MLTPFVRGSMSAVAVLAICGGAGLAQQPSREDAAIEQIRGRSSMTTTDQRQIRDWVAARVEELEKRVSGARGPISAFRAVFKDQYGNRSNTSEFKSQLVIQTTAVAADKFAKVDVEGVVGQSLATVLLDYKRMETIDALLAGLSVKDAGTRMLCLQGLIDLRREISTDNATLQRVTQRLQSVGLAEKNDTVLRQIYVALAFPNQAPLVFDTYMALLDSRLTSRRGPGIYLELAEIELVEFFRMPNVLDALSADQKSQLVARLAILFRQDAERYTAEKIEYYERDGIERRLDGVEAIFVALVGRGKGGDVRSQLESGGHEKRAEILQEVYKWVGDPESKTAGGLNTAPWNVPVGAP